MKKIVLLFLFLFFPFAVCLSGASVVATQPIRQTAEEQDMETWDFGKIKQGKVVKHAFILKNETGKIMNIKDVTTSCGCTASKIKEKTLLPGEATTIDVQFNSEGYSGQVQQYVYVNTDNFDKAILRFSIKAEVVK